MLEIENNKYYRESLLQTSLIVLALTVVLIFMKPSFGPGAVIFGVMIELAILAQTFTESISVDDVNLKIVSYTFFSKKEIVLSKAEIRSKLSKTGSFRSPVYWVLDIMQRNKRIYSIDSRDGFDEDDLVMLDNSINTPMIK